MIYVANIDEIGLHNVVLNSHNLDMILQLKYMPIVRTRPESRRVTGNLRNAMVCDTPYLQNEFGDPRFFLRF